MFNSAYGPASKSGPQAIDNGNVENRLQYRRRVIQNKPTGRGNNRHKRKAMANNDCFVCPKEGCRARKQKDESFKTKNAEYENAAFSASELENLSVHRK